MIYSKIREATPEDIPRIVEMGSRSLREGPYKDERENHEQSAETALRVISQRNGKVLLAECDGITIGLLGFFVYPHYFTGQLTALEMMWYVEAEYRQSMTGIILLRAAERIAREMGAVKMQFTAPTEEVAHAYEMLGYRKMEVCYQRDLNAIR